MTDNQAGSANVHYEGVFARVKLQARVFYEDTRHVMNILRDKIPGMNMPMDTKGANVGYLVEADIPLSPRDTLRVGNELRHFGLNDWWTPVSAMVGAMGPSTLLNVNNGRRDLFGTFVEWRPGAARDGRSYLAFAATWCAWIQETWRAITWLLTQTGSSAYYADATAFNAQDRYRLDNNFDATALARYEPNSTSTFEFGYARKTRSPSLYERYLWVKRSSMSANMNGWFGDGNAYVGNFEPAARGGQHL